MFIQTPHSVTDIERQIKLIEDNPLGIVFTKGSVNGLEATHLPFVVDRDQQDPEKFTLRTHLARANKHWEDLDEAEECLVIFQGPKDDYVSPLWYEETQRTTQKAVPTWDYSTIHIHGKPTIIKDEEWVTQQMTDISDKFEYAREKKWTINDPPQGYVKALKKAVHGLKIEVTKTEGKWKMSQEKSASDVNGVVSGFKAQGDGIMAQEVETANKHSNNI